MEAGKCVCYDDDVGEGWKHLVAVREQNCLKLYINGCISATSSAFNGTDYDVSNTKHLLIGFGAQNYFSGTLDDMRIYRAALDANQVRNLFDYGQACYETKVEHKHEKVKIKENGNYDQEDSKNSLFRGI